MSTENKKTKKVASTNKNKSVSNSSSSSMKVKEARNLKSEKVVDEQFVFVHDNGRLAIKDEKFKTKATTFGKDAFKRFCKNKSSVVGAIIIGILILASIITPLVSPYNTKEDQSWQNLLEPKLVEPTYGKNNSTWNGTKMYNDAVYDPYAYNPVTGEFGLPVAAIREQGKVNPEAIVWMDEPRLSIRDDYSPYAFGGTCINVASKTLKKSDDPNNKPLYTRNLTNPLPFNGSYDYNLSVKMNNDDLREAEIKVTKIRVCASADQNFSTYETLVDWFDLKDEFSVDLKKTLNEKGFDGKKVYLSIEGLQKYVTDSQGVAIKNYMSLSNIEVTTTNEAALEVANALCADGNEMCYPDVTKLVWVSNASRYLKGANYYIVNFLYDSYEHVFGNRELAVGRSLIQEYIDKGWCTFNFDTMELTVLSEKCPIVSVEYKIGDIQYQCIVTYYKYKGLDSKPKYILGSTPEGHDLITKALGCLKTSLLVAIIASAICLLIGLIWGSISGYFGGTVDLVMERVTDIISGVPWIVMMTLIILLLGSNIYTFAIALIMTGWIGTAGTTRTQFYRFRDREYVLASRTLGASDARLIFKHILPNGLGTIVTASVLMIPGCIFSEASVSYLGLGLKGVDSFGVLFSEYQQYLGTQPMLIIFPAIIISLLMISFNLFGNGLRDALNPTLKGGEQ